MSSQLSLLGQMAQPRWLLYFSDIAKESSLQTDMSNIPVTLPKRIPILAIRMEELNVKSGLGEIPDVRKWGQGFTAVDPQRSRGSEGSIVVGISAEEGEEDVKVSKTEVLTALVWPAPLGMCPQVLANCIIPIAVASYLCAEKTNLRPFDTLLIHGVAESAVAEALICICEQKNVKVFGTSKSLCSNHSSSHSCHSRIQPTMSPTSTTASGGLVWHMPSDEDFVTPIMVHTEGRGVTCVINLELVAVQRELSFATLNQNGGRYCDLAADRYKGMTTVPLNGSYHCIDVDKLYTDPFQCRRLYDATQILLHRRTFDAMLLKRAQTAAISKSDSSTVPLNERRSVLLPGCLSSNFAFRKNFDGFLTATALS